MNFLPLSVVEYIKTQKMNGISNGELIKTSFLNETPLTEYLNENLSENFDNLVDGLLNGYEVDETKEHEKVGILNHPFLLKEETAYMPTWIIYYLKDKNNKFDGSIWLPYYSKNDYQATCSFQYESETRNNKMSRQDEIKHTPAWFQELFQKAQKYIRERNEKINREYGKILDDIYKKIKSDSSFTTDINKEHPLMIEIWKHHWKIVPAILQKIQKTNDVVFYQILETIADVMESYEWHGEEEKLKAYLKSKEQPETWKEFWLTWGKTHEFIL